MSYKYELISVEQELPKEGKYIVKTISYYGKTFKHFQVIESVISYNEKGMHSWSCKNQIVTHWFKEI